jgi:acyl-CoA synthetase (NDP forming)
MFGGLLKFAQSSKERKPFCIAIRSPAENLQAEKDRLRMTKDFMAAGIPVFRTVERACRAMYRFTGYYRMVEEAQAEEAEVAEPPARRRAG